MSLANGRPLLAIPGPTNVPDKVLQAMIRPAEDIYAGPMLDLTDSLLSDLKRLFGTSGRTYIYAANGHGGWEAALSNVLSRGDRVLVLASGRFAIGWGEMARFMGAEVEVLEGSWRAAIDPAAVEARLRQDKSHAIKAVIMVQIDTASGVANDVPAIRRAIDAAGHPCLFLVDGVASLACMPFAMDEWGVDVAMSASQKGLMTPPGLAFVAANDKAHRAHETATMKTLYWDWTMRQGEEHYMKYCGTPPEHLLFGLRAALDMIFAEGLPAVFRRHALLAEATHAAVGVWAQGQALSLNIPDATQRAPSVTPVLCHGVDVAELAEFTRRVCGVTLGTGIGALSGQAFRIAHMGHVNAAMVTATLSAVDMALKSLGVPHGAGALDAALALLADRTREAA